MMRLMIAVLALLLTAGVALAEDSDFGPLSVKAQAGVGMNTGVSPAHNYLSTSGIISGDLHYRLNRNVALVPVSMSFYFYSGSPQQVSQYYTNDIYSGGRYGGARVAGTSLGYGNSYYNPWLDPWFQDPYYYRGYGYYGGYNNPPSLAWGLSFTPGIKLQTAGRRLFNLYAQAGAGLYRHNQQSSTYYGVGSLNKTSFAARGEAGVEIIVTQQVNLLLGGGYMWVGDNPAFDGIVNLNMGFRLGF